MTASPGKAKHLTATDHIELVFAVRDALDGKPATDTLLLLREFGIAEPGDFQSVGEVLQEAGDGDLVALARHLAVPLPLEDATTIDISARNIDAYTELVAAETALRNIVRLQLRDTWRDDLDQEKLATLEQKRAEEDKRRDGVTVSQDLLDYTETHQLKTLIDKHWNDFQPVLDDKKRTSVYLDIMLDVRNAIAHSRPVVPSERLLLAGAAGQIQNQLSRYRSRSSGPDAYYASINYIRDSLGSSPLPEPFTSEQPSIPRLSIGQAIVFECSATDPQNREITWLFRLSDRGIAYKSIDLGTVLGTKFDHSWIVTEDCVGEEQLVTVSIQNATRHQRRNGVDDTWTFRYHVNPPH